MVSSKPLLRGKAGAHYRGGQGESRSLNFLQSVDKFVTFMTYDVGDSIIFAPGVRGASVKSSNKIVFFVASFSSIEATAPLGILAISTPLLEAGYDVRIIDSTITPNYVKRVLEEVKDALCLGISVVTGPMIRETVAVAKAVKAWDPDFPVILGGWHPSLLPKQTLEAAYVDIIVRAQGEDSMLEVVQRLQNDDPLDDVLGIGFKRDNKLFLTPERPLKQLTQMPQKAYQLADFDGYERICGRRWAMYVSSLACPFNCSYCTNAAVYGRKWNSLPVDQVVAETMELTRRYRLELLWMADDNFLVDLERALKIAEGLVQAGAKFKWSVQATTNLTARLSVEELSLLRRSGMHQVCQGIETASPTVMKHMNKDFQVLADIYESTERCLRANVIPSFNIIFGHPGEGPKERRETVSFMMDVCRRFPGAEFWTNIFTPYPGSPIFTQAEKLGIEVPTSLEGWIDYFPRYTTLPWLKGKDHQRVQTMRDYLRIAFDREPIAAKGPGRLAKAVQHLTAYPARWRLDHDFYGLPLELWVNRTLKNIVTLPKPSVDAKIMEPAPATSC
jgi:anaerobic magnesium-protoporphyrin IX monomethyl ester cyclase